MDLTKTQFVTKNAAKIAAKMLEDRRLQEKLGSVPDPETRTRIVHDKAASTFLGGLFIVLGLVLLFGDLIGLGYAWKIGGISQTTPYGFLAIALSPAILGVIFLVIGGSNISGDLRKTFGWFALFLQSVVAIFRKLPNAPSPPST